MKHPKHTLIPTYYIALLLAVIAAMAGYRLSQNNIVIEAGHPAGSTLYTIVLLYVIISLPLSLKLFSVGVNRLKEIDDEEKRIRRYRIYGIARISAITLGLVLSILGFYLVKLPNMSFFWLAGISAIGLIFCKPTNSRIDTDMEKFTSDNNDNENTINSRRI